VPAEDWIGAPEAARLLGLELRTVHALISKGELQAVILPSSRPEPRRRSIRLRRQDVGDYIDRARVKPGTLSHLFPPAEGRYR